MKNHFLLEFKDKDENTKHCLIPGHYKTLNIVGNYHVAGIIHHAFFSSIHKS